MDAGTSITQKIRHDWREGLPISYIARRHQPAIVKSGAISLAQFEDIVRHIVGEATR